MSATRAAFRLCRSIRTASVLMPRSISQASNGPATAPVAFCAEHQPARPGAGSSWHRRAAEHVGMAAEILGRRVDAASAPTPSGFCRCRQKAKVLSTTSSAPAFGRAAPPRRSNPSMEGRWLVRCSSPGHASAPLLQGLLDGLRIGHRHRLVTTCHGARTLSDGRWVPPSASSGIGRDHRGGGSRCAAGSPRPPGFPEANSSALAPPSSAARRSSSAALVGFAVLVLHGTRPAGRPHRPRRRRRPGQSAGSRAPVAGVRLLPGVDRQRLETAGPRLPGPAHAAARWCRCTPMSCPLMSCSLMLCSLMMCRQPGTREGPRGDPAAGRPSTRTTAAPAHFHRLDRAAPETCSPGAHHRQRRGHVLADRGPPAGPGRGTSASTGAAPLPSRGPRPPSPTIPSFITGSWDTLFSRGMAIAATTRLDTGGRARR